MASARFHLPPYVDGSCRREPDLEIEFPAISALCRAGHFAPRLLVGDEVVYITTKDHYGESYRHWRLVARLRVLKRFKSHPEASAWYLAKLGELPRNCMVPGNPPLPLTKTARGVSACAPACGGASASLEDWDAGYQYRAVRFPVVNGG